MRTLFQKTCHSALFMAVIMIFMLPASLSAFTVVIDAGHGGHDPGALGKYVKEKDLTLDVSKRLHKLMKDSCESDVQIFMTRSTDVFLTLQERANFVNKHNADLFICIHANSADNKNIKGAETFTLGVDKMQSNLDVAMRENAVMLLEDDYQTKYQGFNPNSVESYIMFEFMQDRHINKSLQFAQLVQEQFSDKLHRADRGVRQAGFWVLHKSACPAVLIEMGFISNADEEKYLRSEQGKTEITRAIFDAFQTYKQQLDKKAESVKQAAAQGSTAAPKTETKPVEKKNNNTKTTKPQQKETPKTTTPASKPAEQKEQTKPAEKKEQTKPAEQKEEQTKAEETKLRPVYRVQIFVTKKPLKEGDPTFKGLKRCKYTKDGQFYKYTYGEDNDYQTIEDIRNQLRGKFKDCFIVAFLGDEQILVKDALKMK